MECYVEFFYPYNPDVGDSMKDTLISRIEERNPMVYADRRDIIGFRFFDVKPGLNYMNVDNRTNISPIYYCGEYLSFDEVAYIHSIMPYTSDKTVMIRCYCGYLVTDVNCGDMTIRDYVECMDENCTISK